MKLPLLVRRDGLDDGYNSLENPIGIETRPGAGSGFGRAMCYNSLENPIGIETRDLPDDVRGHVLGYNSLENPIGIETHTPGVQSNQQSQLQLIRKPDRD